MPRLRSPAALGALTYRDYRLIWTGQVISNMGSAMQQLGLGWLIVQLAERDGVPHLVPVYLGMVGLARGLPTIFAGISAGVIADRVDRRKLLMLIQVYWAVVSGVLAMLTISGIITIWMVVALTALSAVAMAFDGAARQSIFPRLVPPSAIVSAVGLNSMSFNVAQFIGPMIGGFLIGPIGVGGLMLCNALSFIALIWAILASSPLGSREEGVRSGPWRSLQESFEFVWGNPTVKWAMLLSLLGNILARPFQQLFPAFVHDTLQGDASDLSWLMTAAGIGALCGAFGTASLGSLRRRGVVYACAGITLGVLLLLFGAQRTLLPAALLACCVGGASQLFITMASAIYHTHTPDALRGRVMGLSTVAVQGGLSMGAMVLGTLGGVIGISAALSAGGGAYTLIAGGVLARVAPLRQETEEHAARSAAAQRGRAYAPGGIGAAVTTDEGVNLAGAAAPRG